VILDNLLLLALECVDCGMVYVNGYYFHRLSAARLKEVCEIALPRVKQYLDAEVNHVLDKIRPGDLVIELGCGYGRIPSSLAGKAGS